MSRLVRRGGAERRPTHTPLAHHPPEGLGKPVVSGAGSRIYDRSGYDCSSPLRNHTNTRAVSSASQTHIHPQRFPSPSQSRHRALAERRLAAVPCPCRQHGLHSVPHFFPATHAPHTRVSRSDRSSSWSPAPPDPTTPLANCMITHSAPCRLGPLAPSPPGRTPRRAARCPAWGGTLVETVAATAASNGRDASVHRLEIFLLTATGDT